MSNKSLLHEALTNIQKLLLLQSNQPIKINPKKVLQQKGHRIHRVVDSFGDGFPPKRNSEPLAFTLQKKKLTAKAPKKTTKGKSSEPIPVVQALLLLVSGRVTQNFDGRE